MAQRDYFTHRLRGLPHSTATTMLPEEDRKHAADENWDGQFRAARLAQTVDDVRLRPDVEIELLLERRDQVADILRALYDPTSVKPDVNDVEGRLAHVKQVGDYVKFSRELDAITDRIDARLDRAARRTSDVSSLPRWRDRSAALLAQFREQYRGKGPQYETILERLVAAVVMQEQMEQGAAPVDYADHARLAAEIVALTNQIQRYTEATKSTVLRAEVQETLIGFMGIVERIVAPSAPELWNKVVQEVVALVEASADESGRLLPRAAVERAADDHYLADLVAP